MRILRSIIQSLVLSVLDTLEHLVFGGFVAFQFICHQHSWNKALLFQQFTEKALCRLCVSMPLHQNIEYAAICIHSSPQVVLLSFDRDDDLIQMPFIGYKGMFAPHLICVWLSKLLAPFPNGLVGYFNSAVQHHFFNVSIA